MLMSPSPNRNTILPPGFPPSPRGRSWPGVIHLTLVGSINVPPRRIYTDSMKFPLRLLCVFALTLVTPLARAQTTASMIAFGDWGFDNPDRQTCADTMARYVASLPQKPDGTLLLGDNLHVKVRDVNDPIIQRIFEKTYDPKVLN